MKMSIGRDTTMKAYSFFSFGFVDKIFLKKIENFKKSGNFKKKLFLPKNEKKKTSADNICC